MKTDETDNILRTKLYNAEPVAAAPSWDTFQSKRDLLAQPKTKNWLYYTATAVAAAIVGAILMLQPVQIEQITEPAILHATTQSATPVQNTIKEQVPPKTKFTPNVTINAQTQPKPLESTKKQQIEIPGEIAQITTPPTPAHEQEAPKQTPKSKNYDQYKIYDYTKQDVKQSRKLALAAYTNVSSSYGTSQPYAKYAKSSLEITSPGVMTLQKEHREPGTMIVQMGTFKKEVDFSNSDLNHKFPVTVGATMSIPLAKGFAIETGVMYTYLESTTETTSDYTYKYKQSVHYIGIPMAATYRIIGNKALDFYASAGVMAEVAVSSKGKTDVYAAGDYLTTDTRKVNAKGIQMSVNAAIGLNIHLTHRVGIYVEPGVGHYFTNPNQPLTSRTNNPIQFNLRAGFKVQL